MNSSKPSNSIKLNEFLVKNEVYYLESIEDDLLIYRKERLLSAKEIIEMHDFVKKLYFLIPESYT